MPGKDTSLLTAFMPANHLIVACLFNQAGYKHSCLILCQLAVLQCQMESVSTEIPKAAAEMVAPEGGQPAHKHAVQPAPPARAGQVSQLRQSQHTVAHHLLACL